MLQGEEEGLLRAVDVAGLGQGDAQAAGEPHMPVRDEPAHQVGGRVPVAAVEVGAGQQVVRTGFGGGDGVPEHVDGLVGPPRIEEGDTGGGQPAQGRGGVGGCGGQRGRRRGA